MVNIKSRRKRVTFRATKRVSKPVRVSFRTNSGKRVSFVATKKVPKRVTVSFLAKKGKR